LPKSTIRIAKETYGKYCERGQKPNLQKKLIKIAKVEHQQRSTLKLLDKLFKGLTSNLLKNFSF
jgi:hypothetical protein